MLMAARLLAAFMVVVGVQNAGTPLDRFLARGEEPTVEYRALRRLEATNSKFNQHAWMVAWTEYDRANGFRFSVVSEGGSSYIRSKVLRAALFGEQKMEAKNDPNRAPH